MDYIDFQIIENKIVCTPVYNGKKLSLSIEEAKLIFKILVKNNYNYSTANVNENPTVADLGEDSFYIECMECIGIDEDEWSVPDVCGGCIFSEKCVKEEM